MDYDEIIKRMGYFRNEAKLSARETSLRLGYNPQFIKTIENKTVELKVSTLLKFCEIVGISIFDFFYLGKEYNEKNKEILNLFMSLNDKQKAAIIDTMEAMKQQS